MGCVWWELLRVYMFILPLNILIYACVYHAFKKKERKKNLIWRRGFCWLWLQNKKASEARKTFGKLWDLHSSWLLSIVLQVVIA